MSISSMSPANSALTRTYLGAPDSSAPSFDFPRFGGVKNNPQRTELVQKTAKLALTHTRLGKYASRKTTIFNDLLDFVPILGGIFSARNGYKLIKLGLKNDLPKSTLCLMGAISTVDAGLDILALVGAVPTGGISLLPDAALLSNTLNRKIYEKSMDNKIKKAGQQDESPKGETPPPLIPPPSGPPDKAKSGTLPPTPPPPSSLFVVDSQTCSAENDLESSTGDSPRALPAGQPEEGAEPEKPTRRRFFSRKHRS